MEAARAAAVELKHAMTPSATPDQHAMLAGTDAYRRERGLPAHTMESFLHRLHLQVNHPQAPHQNASP
jgi:hypothetical protein